MNNHSQYQAVSKHTTVLHDLSDVKYALDEQRRARYQQVESRVKYSEYQNFLYQRAIHGLSVYSQEEIKTMSWKKRERVKRVHIRTTQALNLLKQKLIINRSNAIFQKFFHSELGKKITMDTATDPKFKCHLTLTQLGLTKKDIINTLITDGLLPKNFMSLTVHPNETKA